MQRYLYSLRVCLELDGSPRGEVSACDVCTSLPESYKHTRGGSRELIRGAGEVVIFGHAKTRDHHRRVEGGGRN